MLVIKLFFVNTLGVENLLNSHRDLEYKDHPMGHNLNELRIRLNLFCNKLWLVVKTGATIK